MIHEQEIRQFQGDSIVHRRRIDDHETVMCLHHDSPLTEQDVGDFRFRWQAEKQNLDLGGQLRDESGRLTNQESKP